MDKTVKSISINAENLMPIIKKWLYSDKDIFVRELIANAVDAVTKHKKLVAMGDAEYDEAPYEITVAANKDAKTVTFSDNGIGMNAEELEKYIGEVAFSGAADFAKRYEKAGAEDFIGHFGLGFYSAFMVAKRIEVLSRSTDGSDASMWSSDGVSEFSIEPAEKAARGTEIRLYLGDDSEEFLDEAALKAVVKKYCGFLPVPIFMGEGEKREQVNDTAPLWQKNAADCTEDEYKEFYRSVFNTYEEPLFWLHLNVDFPFRLKGILYFPRVNPQMGIDGQIKLYNNQVFVADNIKEVTPEFLMLLRGVIDCPDLPLNVSRSMLQNDGTVVKVRSHITKKTADKLNSMFENEREAFEKCWRDIAPFIRYGAVRDEKFFEQIEKSLLFETTEGAFLTLEDIKEKAKNDGGRVYYATDTSAQSFYIDMFKEQGQTALLMGAPADDMFISFLEYKCQGLTFARIDADVAQSVKGQYDDMPELAPLEKLLREAAGDEKLTVNVEPLKNADLLAMLVIDENDRRFYDMATRYSNQTPSVPPSAKLVLNGASPTIKKLAAETDDDKAALIAGYVYDLALLGCGRMNEAQSREFFKRAARVVALV